MPGSAQGEPEDDGTRHRHAPNGCVASNVLPADRSPDWGRLGMRPLNTLVALSNTCASAPGQTAEKFSIVHLRNIPSFSDGSLILLRSLGQLG